MTAVAAGQDLLAPIAAARANDFGLAVRPLPGDPAGWRPAAAVPDLGPLLDAVAAGAGTASRAVAATWLLEGHAWSVASAALAAVLVHGLAPPLDRGLVRDLPGGTVEALALPAEGWDPCDGGQLAARLEAHHAPLVEALGAFRPRRALWRSVGDRVGQAAIWCAEAFGDRDAALALASDVLSAPTALRAPAVFAVVDGAARRRRAGCCLSFRVPGGDVCPDCRIAP